MTSSRVRRALSRVSVALTVALLASIAPVLVPPPAGAAWPSGVVELRGHGWGHGRGLGQYGALGYAVDGGWTYQQILDHYYGDTSAGTVGDGPVTVRLSEFDDRPLVITSGQVFAIRNNVFLPNETARVRREGNHWVVEKATSGGCGATAFSVLEGNVPLAEEPLAAVGNENTNDISQMLIACASNARSYRGRLSAVALGDGSRAVNTVAMEWYLRGVVPRESPASWGDLGGGKGLQALKAQAVAARSYAWAEDRDPKFKTCDTTACQVYGGAGLNGEVIEANNTNAAITQTAGEVRLRGGGVQRTEFSSSTGGYTAGGTFPAVPDAGDVTASNPNHNWTAKLPVASVEAAYPSIGHLEQLVVLERTGLGEDGGRVKRLTLRGDKGTTTVSGDAFRGALGLKSDWFSVVSMTKPAVSFTPSASGNGYWLVSSDGGVFSYGDAVFRGSAGNLALNAPIVGMAARPGGNGYWLLGGDGGIFSFGDAPFFGSTGGMVLNRPVIAMAATPSGNGYWLLASDGGIFTFGDALFYGSTGSIPLQKPVVGMVPTPSGHGYWLVASDGGIFTFGDALFYGSAGAIKLNRPIVGMAATPDGGGYWLAASDGGIFTYGNAPFKGAAAGASQPIVDIASTPSGQGYWLLSVDGGVYNVGDAPL